MSRRKRLPAPRLRHPGRHDRCRKSRSCVRLYFPEWLLERRRRVERGADVGGGDLLPARRVDPANGKLVASLGISSLSKSQVSEMTKELDEHVEQFRTRSLAEAGPFTFLAADALVLKVREGGRVVPVHALIATGVNADGHREILGVQVTSSEDGAGSLGFFRDLVGCGCPGSAWSPVMPPAHRGDRGDPARRDLANAAAPTTPRT